MDIERVVAERLMHVTGIKCVPDVPRERPDEFVQVTLAATSATRFIQSPRVLATSWAKTRRRAREIAEAVADGLSNAEICQRLFLSLSTVKTYLSRIFDKLGVTSRVQLAILVLESR